VTTLMLCNMPFRDLGHMAVVQHTQRSVPHEGRMMIATLDPKSPPASLAATFAQAQARIPTRIDQLVLSGAFLGRHALEQSLAFAAAAVAAGARLVVHNLTLEGNAGADLRPAGAEVLDRATSIEVRDHRTATQLTYWGVATQARILAYPERRIAPDDALAATLPPGPILGVAVRGGDEMRRCWQPRLAAIAEALGPASGWPVLPLHTCVPGHGEDDLGGTRDLMAALHPGASLLLPDLADPKTWQQRITPARLKGLVARCALVVTNRDLPAAYAMAAAVPVLGLALGQDRRIVTCFATLARDLPPGSAILSLPAP
jgi:hypothetical protein